MSSKRTRSFVHYKKHANQVVITRRLKMAFIDYLDADKIPEDCRVNDSDNILRIHSVHARVMKLHFDLYREVMHGRGPLPRDLREIMAVAVSAANQCEY